MKSISLMKRLRVELTEREGEIRGTVSFPADSAFVLEALYLVLRQFSESVELPPSEIAADLYRLAKSDEGPHGRSHKSG